jgi:hypothetical protein
VIYTRREIPPTAYLSRYSSDSYTCATLGSNSFSGKSCTGGCRGRRWYLPFERAQVVVFGGRSKPPISPDDMLDTPPSRLRLGLQPCLSLLDVDYAVDDSSSRCGRVIPKAAKRRKRVARQNTKRST